MGKLAKLSPKSCGFFGSKIKKAARANIVAAKVSGVAKLPNCQIVAALPIVAKPKYTHSPSFPPQTIPAKAGISQCNIRK